MEQLLTILVADDEPELLDAVCRLIDWESIGFRLVGRARNGLDALQLVEELQPDFLLTDIRMPFISGTALTRQAKAVQPLLQVAFLSGYDDFEYAKQGIEDDIVAYLLKPISMAELTEALVGIHRKVEKRLSALTARQSGVDERQLLAATLLLDDYLHDGVQPSLDALRAAGMDIAPDSRVCAAALRVPGAEPQAVLSMAERLLARFYACSGFCSGDRAVLLLASPGGFPQLFSPLGRAGARPCAAPGTGRRPWASARNSPRPGTATRPTLRPWTPSRSPLRAAASMPPAAGTTWPPSAPGR